MSEKIDSKPMVQNRIIDFIICRYLVITIKTTIVILRFMVTSKLVIIRKKKIMYGERTRLKLCT